jgi:hypothetical protein
VNFNPLGICRIEIYDKQELEIAKKKYTLFVDGWSSNCGNCGKGCNPDEKQHDTNLGYGITNETRKGYTKLSNDLPEINIAYSDIPHH